MSGEMSAWLCHGMLASLGAFLCLLGILVEACWRGRKDKREGPR